MACFAIALCAINTPNQRPEKYKVQGWESVYWIIVNKLAIV